MRHSFGLRGGNVLRVSAALIFALVLLPRPAAAYIGPGAGFAFLGSTAVFLVAGVMAVMTLLFWPFQFVWRKITGKGISSKARARRVVIVGLDGLEPRLVDRFMSEGVLPNFKRLMERGGYRRLGTTLPPLSPVAWSTFQTGVNPGSHNIFDFLTRDKRTCLPELCSTTIDSGGPRFKIGPFKIGRRAPTVVITRRSTPFWKILGKRGIASNIIRVPISYPPEKFEGNILSAMCTPDLRGTQGSFTFVTTDRARSEAYAGGEFQHVELRENVLEFDLLGPPNPKQGAEGSLKVRCAVTVDRAAKTAVLRVCESTVPLKLGEFSDWVPVQFTFGRRGVVHGISRFCLREVEPHVSVYVSPVNVSPENPALPISAPIFFSSWLAKEQGLFGTLGLMEDTWGRNELALDDRRFLDQAYLTHDEREKMFFEVLGRTKEGVCVCVFDASDRIQHMFWRYIDDKHPSPRESDEFLDAIPAMYRKMDGLVGRVLDGLRPNDVLCVVSDHGFSSFRRGVNLNTWLMQNGYLVTKNGVTGSDYLQDVDWSKTRAFAVGLTGLYINRQGRERFGIVPAEEAEALAAEIAQKLTGLPDTKDGARAIRKVYQSEKVYRGLYTAEAPDLIVGYEPGYRVSWDSVTGTIESELFSDNLKAWSGDHQVDPSEIPGIFFSNRPIKAEAPHISDIAPTVLNLFAVPIPKYMEGKVVL